VLIKKKIARFTFSQSAHLHMIHIMWSQYHARNHAILWTKHVWIQNEAKEIVITCSNHYKKVKTEQNGELAA
jgi:hypothetical protein